MKRILLTTTSLVLAAGVAQADITWSQAQQLLVARDRYDNGASEVATQQCRYVL